MGFTKNKAWSIVITLILAIVFNISMFIIPLEHGTVFWLGYSFEMLASIFLLATELILLGKVDINDKFHGLSSMYIGWIYFVIQTVLSIKQMTSLEFPYLYGIIGDIVLAAIASILLILTFAAGREIKKVESETNKKIFFIRNLHTDIELLNTNDEKSKAAIHQLAEAVRFSDPMSHSELSDIEKRILEKFNLLKNNLDSASIVIDVCNDMQRLLNERNQKCKILKNVPEPQNEKDNSGVSIIAGTFGIISIAALLSLAIVFIVIPNSKYNRALELYNGQKYEEALNTFKELGNYKDSINKIDEISGKIQDEKYMLAEENYKSQNYAEAMKLYEELEDYKNSKDRIEQIYNRLADGDEIYFGTYKGEIIPWKILKTEQDRMLLITENTVENVAFNDDVKNITYENSTIREWLNSDFLKDFSDGQKERILDKTKNSDDGVFILSKEEYEEYSKNVSLNTDNDWWLRTKTPAGMMFVYGQSNEINESGESVIRAIGVRPCVWISLK